MEKAQQLILTRKTPSTSHKHRYLSTALETFGCLEIWAENPERTGLLMQSKMYLLGIKLVFPTIFLAFLPPLLLEIRRCRTKKNMF